MAAVGPAPSTDAARGEQRSRPGRVAAHCEESARRRAASTDVRFLAPGSGLGGSQEEQESRGAHGAISSGQSPSTPALRDETHLCGRLGPGVSKADCRRCALKKWRGHFSITGESLAVTGASRCRLLCPGQPPGPRRDCRRLPRAAQLVSSTRRKGFP